MLKAGRILQTAVLCLGALNFLPASADALEGPIARSITGGAAQAPNSPPTSNNFEAAVRYEHGEGVPQDYARALTLYCEAAAQNDARAYQNLGWMFLNGRGVSRDDAIAVVWFRKAADSGSEQASNLLRTLASVTPAAKNGCPEPTAAPQPVEAVVAPPAIREMVQKIAPGIGLDSNLVMAVISAESAFDAHAVSPKNAMGLMQLMPDTATRFGVRDPFDPAQNIRGGATYLRWLLTRFRGNVTLALAAYNAGETTVESYGGVPPFDETIQYIERIRLHYRFDGKPHL